MQEIKGFIQGADPSKGGKLVMTPIPDQINAYLKENPDRTAKSICTFVGAQYKESFVIFDIWEPKNKASSGQIRNNSVSAEDGENGNTNGTDDRRSAGHNPDRRVEKITNKGVKN